MRISRGPCCAPNLDRRRSRGRPPARSSAHMCRRSKMMMPSRTLSSTGHLAFCSLVALWVTISLGFLAMPPAHDFLGRHVLGRPALTPSSARTPSRLESRRRPGPPARRSANAPDARSCRRSPSRSSRAAPRRRRRSTSFSVTRFRVSGFIFLQRPYTRAPPPRRRCFTSSSRSSRASSSTATGAVAVLRSLPARARPHRPHRSGGEPRRALPSPCFSGSRRPGSPGPTSSKGRGDVSAARPPLRRIRGRDEGEARPGGGRPPTGARDRRRRLPVCGIVLPGSTSMESAVSLQHGLPEARDRPRASPQSALRAMEPRHSSSTASGAFPSFPTSTG